MAKFSAGRNLLLTLQRWAALLSGGLSFEDNFDSYEWSGEIVAGAEKRISHPLGKIPTRFLVTYSDATPLIVRGVETPANDAFFYVRNASSTSTFKGKILILA